MSSGNCRAPLFIRTTTVHEHWFMVFFFCFTFFFLNWRCWGAEQVPSLPRSFTRSSLSVCHMPSNLRTAHPHPESWGAVYSLLALFPGLLMHPGHEAWVSPPPPPAPSRFWVVFLLGMEPRGMRVNKQGPSLNYDDRPPFSLRRGWSPPACEHPHYKPAGIFRRSGHWLKDNSPAFGWQWLSLWMLALDFWSCMCLGNQEMLMSLDWQPPSRAH